MCRNSYLVVWGLALALIPAPSVGGTQIEPGQDGKIVFSSNRDGDPELFVINADGTGLRQLTHNNRPDYDPTWSPDGKQVAFVRDRGLKGESVMIISASGGPAKPFFRNCSGAYDPQWSPDGEWIAFEMDVGEDGSDVDAHSVSGHDVKWIAWAESNSTNGNPAWSPDGTQIAYVESYEFGEIYITPFDHNSGGNDQLVATTESVWGNELDWSPDGSSLLYSDVSAEIGSTWDIYVVPVTGGSPVRVIGTGSEEFAGEWSPDGTAFVYSSNEHGSQDLFIASSDGKTIRRLTTHPGREVAASWWGRSRASAGS